MPNLVEELKSWFSIGGKKAPPPQVFVSPFWVIKGNN